MPGQIGQLADASHGPATAPWERPSRGAHALGPIAADLTLGGSRRYRPPSGLCVHSRRGRTGPARGGTILLGMTGTILPIMSGLRSPPIEAIGARE
jgi:hypothetical protein